MSSSEISLLRKELAMVVTENRNLQKKISENETAFASKITLLEMEIDLLGAGWSLQSATEDWKNTRTLIPLPPRIRCTTQNAPPSENVWRGRMQTDGRTDLNQRTGTRFTGGRRQDTRACHMATRPRGQSRCICANARHVGAGTSPMVHTQVYRLFRHKIAHNSAKLRLVVGGT